MTESRNPFLEVSEAAAHAIINQASYYEEQSPDGSLSVNWEEAVTRTVQSLLSMPERGAKCQFKSPKLRGMRRVIIQGFPEHSVFCVFVRHKRVIRIIDVVHGARDLDALFSDTAG